MTGRTNASAGGASIELLWTNPSPDSNYTSGTFNFPNYFGFVVSAKSYANHTSANLTCTRNWIAVGDTFSLTGASQNNFSKGRTVTATKNGLTISTSSDGADRCIPEQIWGIK